MSTLERSPVGEFTPLVGLLDHDPYTVVDALGQAPPFWVEDSVDGGYWVATRYEDVRDIFRDSERFSSVEASVPRRAFDEPLLPSFTDPPETNKLRAMLLPHFTRTRVMALQDRMRSVCAELLDAIAAKGHCEAVTEFASVYPIVVFAEFFGLPQERLPEFRHQAHVFLHDEPNRGVAWARIREIIREMLEERIGDPGDGLLGALANATLDGERIELRTAANLASTIFIGGLDTLPSNIAWSLRYLAGHPELRQEIIDEPDCIPDAVEEFLRYFSVSNPRRRAKVDLEVGGSLMRAGDRVICMVSSADRDPAEFGDADVVRFDRETNRHLAFANGVHRCLGSHLARLELGIALREWHARIPHYRVAADDDRLGFHGGVLALVALPLEWDLGAA